MKIKEKFKILLYTLKKVHLFINRIVNFVLLSLVYVFGVGGTWVASRILKKRFLETGINQKAVSYWEDILPEEDKVNYYRQF